MHNDSIFPVSIEEFAAYLDGNLTVEDMNRVSSIIDCNSDMHSIAESVQLVDETFASYSPLELTLPDDISSMDFKIPQIDNIDILPNGFEKYHSVACSELHCLDFTAENDDNIKEGGIAMIDKTLTLDIEGLESPKEQIEAFMENNLNDSEKIKIQQYIITNPEFGELLEDVNEFDADKIEELATFENNEAETITFNDESNISAKHDDEHSTKGSEKLETHCNLEESNSVKIGTSSKIYGYEPNYQLDKFDPNIYQGINNTCAIRCQQIVLRDYGLMFDQNELVDHAIQMGWFNPDPENGGTDKYSVGNLIDECGIHTTRNDNANIYDLIAELRAGHRVIVNVDANELWVKNEKNLFKRLFGEAKNKVNDSIQGIRGVEGANHAVIVAGVNVNPSDPSDIHVTLIDSGTGDVCIEYEFKDFQKAWEDGNCRMISTDIPAPFQYNYLTHQMEPSGFNTEFKPSMAEAPTGLNNIFQISSNYIEKYEDYNPLYDEDNNHIPYETNMHDSHNNDDVDNPNPEQHEYVNEQVDDVVADDGHYDDTGIENSKSSVDINIENTGNGVHEPNDSGDEVNTEHFSTEQSNISECCSYDPEMQL